MYVCHVTPPCLVPLSLPIALTADNVLRELKDVSWKTLSWGKTLSEDLLISINLSTNPGVLKLPESQRYKIEAEYTTEDQWRNAAVHSWLVSDPYASWRRLITELDQYEEYDVAKQIHRYAEKLTGMTCTHQIAALCVFKCSSTKIQTATIVICWSRTQTV